MAEYKTKPTSQSVSRYIDTVDHAVRRNDAKTLLTIFDRLTGLKPQMWGESLIGYGNYHYKYASGREGDYFLTGFSPRKAATTIYIMPGFDLYKDQLRRLGPHRHSRSCLYITRLERVELAPLEEMIIDSVKRMKAMYQWKA